MQPFPVPAKPEAARADAGRRVLLLVGSPPLLARMSEVVRSIAGAQLAAAYSYVLDLVDWAMWDRDGWSVAYVELNLAGSDDAVRRLLAARRPGTVVGVVDHMWREVREQAASLGVHTIVEKGDLVALRDDLERRVR